MPERFRPFLIPALIVIALVAIGEGLFITYPSWSPWFSFLSLNSGAATTTPRGTVSSEPIRADEHAQYYDIEAEYPQITALKASAGATADAKAISALRGFVEDEKARFKADSGLTELTPEDIEMQGLGDGRKYALDIEYAVHSSPSTVSYVFTIYADTLGAHPNGYFRTFVFDLQTGANLTLDDLFTGDPAALLSQVSRVKLPAIIAKTAGVSDAEFDVAYMNSGTTAEADNFQSFYLDGTNFVILFPPYQVGPYALGPVELTIPRSELSTSLKANYR